ncbi:MAG: hypothetical protein U0992_10215 [Planctomycetaceae bacterium]
MSSAGPRPMSFDLSLESIRHGFAAGIQEVALEGERHRDMAQGSASSPARRHCKIVTSLVTDMITPVIGNCCWQDFNNLFIWFGRQ